MVELLEKRMFLSVTGVQTDIRALRADQSALRSDVTAWSGKGSVRVEIIASDLQQLGLLPAKSALLKSYAKDGGTGLRQLSTTITTYTQKIGVEASRFLAAYKRAAANPGKAKAASNLAAEREKLSTLAASMRAAIDSAVALQVAKVTADLNNVDSIVMGDLQTQSDIALIESSISANANGAVSEAATVFSDIGELAES